MKRTLYLILSCTLFIVITACGNIASYDGMEVVTPPTRSTTESRPVRRNVTRGPVPQRSVPRHMPVPQPPIPPPIPKSDLQVAPPPPSTPCTQEGPHPHNREASERTPTRSQPASQNPVPKPSAAPQKEAAPKPTASPTNQNVRATANNRVLASHKTEFDTKDQNRSNNIIKASSSINGHVVQPGETFSYNQTVGPTNERRGYEKSIIYVEGEKKEGVGGGVCQVSTTLSIAADNAGMEIIERHDHSRPVGYAKEGEEAATSYGGLDFKFKNNQSFPIVIKSAAEGGSISVSICEG